MAARHYLVAVMALVVLLLSPAVESAAQGSCKMSGKALGVNTKASGNAYLTITANQTATIKITITSLKNFFMSHIHTVRGRPGGTLLRLLCSAMEPGFYRRGPVHTPLSTACLCLLAARAHARPARGLSTSGFLTRMPPRASCPLP